MELEDKPIDPQESLQLIQKFITGARYNAQQSSFGFIFWGILIAAAALINYFLVKFTASDLSWLPWPILTIGGFIATTIYYSRKGKKEGIVSTFGRFFRWLFFCGGITYFLLVFLCVKQNISPTPFMLALTSLLIAVSGFAVRYKPLIVGGILFFVAAIVSVFISPVNQLLLITVLMLIGYLLPGILLVRKREE